MNKHWKTMMAGALAVAIAGLFGPFNAIAATSPSSTSMSTYVVGNQRVGNNWFGGTVYTGQPDLAATAALVRAGGGADHFDFATALVAMLGQDTVNKEVAKLNKQYGEQEVELFLSGMTFAVQNALKRATEQGIKLPAPANLSGAELASGLVTLGTTPDGTFWSGYLFDRTISHGLHNQVMGDIDAKFGMNADGITHKILNQAMFDVAQALGMRDVKLASLH